MAGCSKTKNSVEVRFVDDDNVLEQIYPLSDARDTKKKTARRLSTRQKAAKDDEENEVEVENQEEVPVPIGLHATDGSSTGRQMYNLQRTPSSKSAFKDTGSSKATTPKSSRKETPHGLRQKVKQKLSRMKADRSSSSDEESDSEKSSPDEREEREEEIKSYFTLSSKSRAKTSNHMLSKLGRPVMSLEEINEILSRHGDPHEKHREKLLREYGQRFKKWMALLTEGFNLLFYGVGSKMKLLQRFKKDLLSDYPCVTVNGFNPGISVQEVVSTILRQVMKEESPAVGIANQVEQVTDHFSCRDAEDLFLLINNLDGTALRREKAQAVLAQLACAPHIHVVACVDHINASLLWDQERWKAFRFIWVEATTLEPYVLESSLEPLKNNASTTLSSLRHVFRSLTPNARNIFVLIARYQLNNKDTPGYVGLSFQECYRQCREAFLVNSDLTLRTQLTEFLDHMLLKMKKGHDGAENLTIPLDAGTLQLFLDGQEDDS